MHVAETEIAAYGIERIDCATNVDDFEFVLCFGESKCFNLRGMVQFAKALVALRHDHSTPSPPTLPRGTEGESGDKIFVWSAAQ